MTKKMIGLFCCELLIGLSLRRKSQQLSSKISHDDRLGHTRSGEKFALSIVEDIASTGRCRYAGSHAKMGLFRLAGRSEAEFPDDSNVRIDFGHVGNLGETFARGIVQ